jgi:molybdopterin/thiamine biosynthesis adenylyltransferase
MSDDRYSRQVMFSRIGEQGQQKLSQSRAIIIGCGGLGSVSADILVRAGIGFLRICDRDFVETSNLQRQVLFDEQDVARNLPKAEAARRKLQQTNSSVSIEACVTDVDPSNILGLVRDVDLILDGTDNFETRYLINDAAVSLGMPWVYGAAAGSEGMSTVILPGQTACLTCLFERTPPSGTAPTCDTVGVISPIIHMISSIQCIAAIKVLSGVFSVSDNRLWLVDAWSGEVQAINTASGSRVDCETCSLRNFPHLDAKRGSYATTICGRNAVQVSWTENHEVDIDALARSLGNTGEVTVNRFMLKFKCSEAVIAVFPDGRAIIEGTNDPGRARELYAKYVG